MKKVIQGLIYDTDKAEEIASYRKYSPTDFNHVEESLYKTKNGRYFLAGEGGARSKYAEQVDQNTWGGGWGIIPVTAGEALAWCENHDVDPDIIAREFVVSEA